MSQKVMRVIMSVVMVSIFVSFTSTMYALTPLKGYKPAAGFVLSPYAQIKGVDENGVWIWHHDGDGQGKYEIFPMAPSLGQCKNYATIAKLESKQPSYTFQVCRHSLKIGYSARLIK